MGSGVITEKLLYTERSGDVMPKYHINGHKRVGWVSSMIKFSARKFASGESIDSLIKWKNGTGTGNNFQNLNTFLEAMKIADREYGIKSNYRMFKGLTFKESKEIMLKESIGVSVKKIVEEHHLYSENIVHNLERNYNNKVERLISALEKSKINFYNETILFATSKAFENPKI